MGRKCRRLCEDPDGFRLNSIWTKRTLGYKNGSYCSACAVWIKIPTIDERVICKCCGTQARGKSHHSDNNRLRNKIFNTFPRKTERIQRRESNKIQLEQEYQEHLKKVKQWQEEDGDVSEESVFAYTGEIEHMNTERERLKQE